MADRKTVMSWLEGLAQDDWREWHSDSEVQTTAQAALDLLKEQPEIVRCNDCRYYDPDCQICDNGLDSICPPDWFCADGERREG